MSAQGWVSLHRKFKEWEWYDDSKIVHLFLHCLLRANHKQAKWRGQIIEVGQFITSQTKLATELGLTVQQVRTIINKLKSTGEITVTITNKYSIISITNWCEYQVPDKLDNTQATGKQQSNNIQSTTNNNKNNNNNENNEDKEPVPAKKKKPQEIVEIEYPSELNKQAWHEWIDHRKQAKMKKLTPKGEVLAMKNLVAMGDYDMQRAIIEQSMSQGWTGLFLLKGEKPSQKNKRDDIMAFVYGDGNGRREEKIIEGEAYETE